MAAAADRGDRVVCVSMTAGEQGTADPETVAAAPAGTAAHWEAAAAMAVLGVTDHRILGMPDGALAEPRRAGPRRHRRAARRGRARHDPDVRSRRHHLPSRSHRRVALGDRSVAPARVSRPAAVRRTSPSRHFARVRPSCTRTWGIYMTDERPVGIVPDELWPASAARRLAARPQDHRARGDGRRRLPTRSARWRRGLRRCSSPRKRSSTRRSCHQSRRAASPAP